MASHHAASHERMQSAAPPPRAHIRKTVYAAWHAAAASIDACARVVPCAGSDLRSRRRRPAARGGAPRGAYEFCNQECAADFSDRAIPSDKKNLLLTGMFNADPDCVGYIRAFPMHILWWGEFCVIVSTINSSSPLVLYVCCMYVCWGP
eukprot:COSAG01_NODE_615_length_14818_cov_9.454039_6_plen_149_part_00